jgi:Tol biopolymer transport system component
LVRLRPEEPSQHARRKAPRLLKSTGHSSIYVGELEANGTHLKAPRRLTLSDDNNFPAAWTPDSQAILFSSDRNGRWKIFKQASEESADPLVTDPGNNLFSPYLSPDGSWVVYLAVPRLQSGVGTSTRVNLMRLPVSGGSPQLVLTSEGYAGHLCAGRPANTCILGELNSDRKQMVFVGFDPVAGRGRELMKIDTDPNAGYNWDLSPDGSRLAIAKSGEQEGHIQIRSLTDGSIRDVRVKGWRRFNSLQWARDTKGLYVSTDDVKGPTLLHVDLQGKAHVLWLREGHAETYGVPSPNGRKLAVSDGVADTNAWMIENF